MSASRRRIPPRFVPRAVGRVGLVAAVYFWSYAAVCLMRWRRILSMLTSPDSGDVFAGAAILGGLFVSYGIAVAPAWIEERDGAEALRRVVRSLGRRKGAVTGLVLLLLLVLAAVQAPLVAPFDPAGQNAPALTQYHPPSLQHPMGTDKFGRDVLSRVVYGARLSLSVAALSVVFSSLIGLLWGAFAGSAGGVADDVAMRIVDGLLAFPRLILILTLVAFFAHSIAVVVALLAVTGWMGTARLVRAEVLSLKEREFVQAAVAAGAGRLRVVLRHLVPNTLGVVVVAATLRAGNIILLESYLSFLGLGAQPPAASWGTMVYDGRDVLLSAWWVSAFPGLAIAVAVVACNLLGDSLRDALDFRAG